MGKSIGVPFFDSQCTSCVSQWPMVYLHINVPGLPSYADIIDAPLIEFYSHSLFCLQTQIIIWWPVSWRTHSRLDEQDTQRLKWLTLLPGPKTKNPHLQHYSQFAKCLRASELLDTVAYLSNYTASLHASSMT
jgi:hypothetical protein